MGTSYNLRNSGNELAIPLPRIITKIALATVLQSLETVCPQLSGRQYL